MRRPAWVGGIVACSGAGNGGRTLYVYLLYHTNEVNPGEDDDKLIGVYSTRDEADAARRRASTLPGFRDVPEGFVIDEYKVDEDHWTEGYITVRPGEG